MRLVQDLKEVAGSVRAFNEGLAVGHSRLRAGLRYNRVWYYVPQLDLVGPSKFVGYQGMTAELYESGGALDGRETEPVLKQWFQECQPGSPEEAFIRSRVEALVAAHGRAINRVAKFCAPLNWRAPGNAPAEPVVSAHPGLRRVIPGNIVRGEEAGFVATCDSLGVVTQGKTMDEVVENLREGVALRLEGEDLAALGLAPDPVLVVSLEIQPWAA